MRTADTADCAPDPNAPGFADECHRQSLLVQQDSKNLEDLEAFSTLADWDDGQ
ncbi:antitoxin MazE-like protein [Geomonas sp. Red276]